LSQPWASFFVHGLAAGRRIAYELAGNQAKAEIAGFNLMVAQEEVVPESFMEVNK
jgi:hypothetical protein